HGFRSQSCVLTTLTNAILHAFRSPLQSWGYDSQNWAAILILAKTCSSPQHPCIVMTSKKPRRARAVEKARLL
ncbi:MAG: hypothetical protein P5697_24810, partial [Limnospira sp. PMC 1256.20]